MYKFAKDSKESNWLSRYLASTVLDSQRAVEHPYKVLASSVPSAIPGLGMLYHLGGGPAATLKRLTGGATEETQETAARDLVKKLDERSVLGNTWEGAKKWGPMGGLIGAALMGTAVGARYGNLSDALAGAGIGGVAGLVGGGFGGATAGFLNKLLSKTYGEDAKEHSIKLTKKHPYATALPFGNVVGAVKNQSKSAEDLEVSLTKRASEIQYEYLRQA